MNDRSLPLFQRLTSFFRGVRSPCWCAAQFQGCPSNSVTSGCISSNSSSRTFIGNEPITPTETSTSRSS